MRTPLIVANWKMYKTLAEVQGFFKDFLPQVEDIKDRDIVICPPAVFLQEAHNLAKGSNVAIGAQNTHSELQGAYTGEVSLQMVKDFCNLVIVGHSERRTHCKETDDDVQEKLRLALSNDFNAILCVGERLEQRQFGETNKVVEDQVTKALQDIPADKAEYLTVAYEPVWAIGTGVNATPAEAQEVHKLIRSLLAKQYKDKANKIRIIYGGSVSPDNIKELMKEEDIDGVLVGGASLNPMAFAAIAKF